MRKDKYEIFDNAPLCGGPIADLHLSAFAKSFVTESHSERWQNLLTKRRHKSLKHSSKLESHLNKCFCKLIHQEKQKINKNSEGVYFDFLDNPITVSIEDGFSLGYYSDGILSINPGKFAYYFSHEGHAWLCEKT